MILRVSPSKGNGPSPNNVVYDWNWPSSSQDYPIYQHIKLFNYRGNPLIMDSNHAYGPRPEQTWIYSVRKLSCKYPLLWLSGFWDFKIFSLYMHAYSRVKLWSPTVAPSYSWGLLFKQTWICTMSESFLGNFNHSGPVVLDFKVTLYSCLFVIISPLKREWSFISIESPLPKDFQFDWNSPWKSTHHQSLINHWLTGNLQKVPTWNTENSE